jgi:hypothetical protein
MHETTAWDGYPPNPERAGYHWLRRTDAHGPMPAVIWTWRPEVQAWRWKGEAQTSPEEQAATKEYIAPVTDHAEVARLRAALLECAGDLEDELRARYGTPPHPVEARRFARDMETVQMARRLANGE